MKYECGCLFCNKHLRPLKTDACVLDLTSTRQLLIYKVYDFFKQTKSSIAETVVGPPIAVGAPKCAPQFTKSPTYWMCSVF